MVLTLLSFSPGLNNGFVWDDAVLIKKSPALSAEVFVEPYYVDARERPQLNYYRPVPKLSFALDRTIWGDNAFGFHLTNLLFHCFNGILLYLLFRKVAFRRELALAGSALFLLHPIVTQPVYWISGRTDLLCAAFILLTLLSYLGFCRRGTVGYGLLSLVFFSVALAAKEMALSLPFILIIISLRHETLKKRAAAFVLSSHFVVLLGYLYLRFQVLEIGTTNWHCRPTTFLGMVVTSCRIFIHYVKQLVFPHPLIVEYDPAAFVCEPLHYVHLSVFACALLFAAGALYSLWRNDKLKTAVFPLCFLFSYVPISNVYPFYPPVADRFVYLPLVFFIGTLLGPLRLLVKEERHIVVAVFVVCLIGAGRVAYEAPVYVDDNRLFRTMIKQSPKHYLGYLALASTLVDEGRDTEAEEILSKTLDLPYPSKGPQRYSRLLQKRGKHQEAVEVLRKALEKGIADQEYYLAQLVSALLKRKEYKEALDTLQKMKRTIKIAHNYQSLEIDLLGRLQRWQEVVAKAEAFLGAHGEKTSSIAVRRNLALALAALGQHQKALALLRDNASHRYGRSGEVELLAKVLSRMGYQSEAISVYATLLPNGPLENKDDQLNVMRQAVRCFAAKQLSKAETLWRRALTGPVAMVEIHAGLAILLLQQGRLKEASEVLNKSAQCEDATKGHKMAAQMLSHALNSTENDLFNVNLLGLNKRDRLFVTMVLNLMKAHKEKFKSN